MTRHSSFLAEGIWCPFSTTVRREARRQAKQSKTKQKPKGEEKKEEEEEEIRMRKRRGRKHPSEQRSKIRTQHFWSLLPLF